MLGPDRGLEGVEKDTAICIGTFTIVHAPKESLLQFPKAIRPYGHIVFTLRSVILEKGGCGYYLRNKVESEARTEDEVSENRQALRLEEPDALHRG